MKTDGFTHVSIIGIGLIGGSLGQALVKFCPEIQVTGIVRRPEMVEKVLTAKAAHKCTMDLASGVSSADLVVLAMPVDIICEYGKKIVPYLKQGCIVTDVGSTKTFIVDTLSAVMAPKAVFIGSHPMAGSEKTSLEYAHPEIFKNANCIITPVKSVDIRFAEQLKKFWEHVGCRVKLLSPDTHDMLVCAISHIPHLIAACLVNAADTVQSDSCSAIELAATGFKDTTRIASGSPDMWKSICFSNKNHIIHQLEHIEQMIRFLRSSLQDENNTEIMNFLKKARDIRDSLYQNDRIK